AVPRLRPPRVPTIDEVRGGDRQVSISMRIDPTFATVWFRVYRTRDEASADVRLMRPIADVPGPRPRDPGGPPPPLDESFTYVDRSVLPDVTYFYRVAALDADLVASEPTGVLVARPWSDAPPEPPQLVSVLTAPSGFERVITLRVPRRDYTVNLFRRQRGTPSWRFASLSRPDGTLDVGLMPAVRVDGLWQFVITDAVDPAGARWAYRARVTDPAGRYADSAVVEQTP
ncbi:MAG: hypothetical protein ACRDGN_01225, partial [bacterium]